MLDMLTAVPQLVASILLVVVFSTYRQKWQNSTFGQLAAFALFSLVESGSVVMVLLSANTSLAATTTIAVSSTFAAALVGRPILKWYRSKAAVPTASKIGRGTF